MAAVASYLADTSALARLRHPPVAAALGPLIEAGLVATCGGIEFELGWATRTTAEFDQLRADRDAGYEWPATHDGDWRRALDVQGALQAAGKSGRPASLTCSSPPWPNGPGSVCSHRGADPATVADLERFFRLCVVRWWCRGLAWMG